MKEKCIIILVSGWLFHCGCSSPEQYLNEEQVTFDESKNHDLDNNDNFSPDGKWLVYDTRSETGGIGGCGSIERVNTVTGETEVIYEIPGNGEYGPGVGAASYHPFEDQVIFIHGLQNSTPQNPYQQWRRTGVIVPADRRPVFMDSRDVTFPYTPGALRGGTHRHEWSRDGKWIGFTYNDAILKKLEDSTGVVLNLRTIGVSARLPGITVDQDAAGENVQGEWFSALVVRVVPDPEPGSDQISHAASDSWVGSRGYRRPDGSWQVARAFLGRVTSRDGKQVDELFVVDIPDSIHVRGDDGPLEGTPVSMPMPPARTGQRRLTFTAFMPYPGCSGVVRSSSDGKKIAFVASDSTGIRQLFLISPEGGTPSQLTRHASDVQSGARWRPGDQSVCYIWNNCLVKCEVSDRPFKKRVRILTAPSANPPSNPVWSNDGTLIAFNRMVTSQTGGLPVKQIFILRMNPSHKTQP